MAVLRDVDMSQGKEDTLIFSLKHPGTTEFYFKAENVEQLKRQATHPILPLPLPYPILPYPPPTLLYPPPTLPYPFSHSLPHPSLLLHHHDATQVV